MSSAFIRSTIEVRHSSFSFLAATALSTMAATSTGCAGAVDDAVAPPPAVALPAEVQPAVVPPPARHAPAPPPPAVALPAEFPPAVVPPPAAVAPPAGAAVPLVPKIALTI